jgi:hypothetical protein
MRGSEVVGLLRYTDVLSFRVCMETSNFIQPASTYLGLWPHKLCKDGKNLCSIVLLA